MLITFDDLIKRLGKLSSDDFFKTGFEVTDEAIYKKQTANSQKMDYTRLKETSPLYKDVKGIVEKIEDNKPGLYKDITETNDTKCDIRPYKKNDELAAKGKPRVYGVFPDGSDVLEEVYLE